MHNFEPLKTAGITPGTLAKLLGVSRVTASQWMNGHANPHKLLTNRVERFLRMVALALEHKLLPLPAYPGRKNVFPSISSALVEAVKKSPAEFQ
jgi:hypothetical protein